MMEGSRGTDMGEKSPTRGSRQQRCSRALLGDILVMEPDSDLMAGGCLGRVSTGRSRAGH